MKRGKRVKTLVDRLVDISYHAFFFFWIASTILFAIIYVLLSYMNGNGPVPVEGTFVQRFFQSLYFSVITATSTGFGDIVPHGISRMFAALQSATSVVALAVFVAKVSARRQDIILGHVHALAFGVAFNDIRQGLFVARKDMDVLLKKLRGGEHLTSKDWMNLHVSLREIQIFLRSVPNFYNAHKHGQIVIDGQEALLFDAVDRTLRKTIDIMDTFERAGCSITRNNEDCTRELHNLHALVEKIFSKDEKFLIDGDNTSYLKEVVITNTVLKEKINLSLPCGST